MDQAPKTGTIYCMQGVPFKKLYYFLDLIAFSQFLLVIQNPTFC